MREFEGKYAVITGANRGIGKAVAEKLTENGANIFALVRNTDTLADIADHAAKHGTELIPVCCDLSDEASVTACAKKILSYKVPISLLINNAGVMYPESVLNMTPVSRIKDVFQINLFSPLLLTQLISKNMIKHNNGNIIFVSSSAAFDAGSNVEYCSSKAAVLCAAKRLATEYGSFNIRVNTVCPGPVDTDMGNMISEKTMDHVMAANIVKRKIAPSEVAETILFLASERSGCITGQTFRIDSRIN